MQRSCPSGYFTEHFVPHLIQHLAKNEGFGFSNSRFIRGRGIPAGE